MKVEVTGLVTIEDLIEEIVGEIQDEYDTETPVLSLRDWAVLIDASLAIRDLNEDHGFDIPESNEYDTISGFLISHLQRIPTVELSVRDYEVYDCEHERQAHHQDQGRAGSCT